jgi:hypothetical protein
MKKLLLGALLTLSITVSAQDTFVKKYTSYVTKVKDVLQPWVQSEITVVFNADNVRDIVFYYTDGKVKRLHQITGATEGKTVGGDGYQIIECVDTDGVSITLQLFDDDRCLRLIIIDGYLIEFHK